MHPQVLVLTYENISKHFRWPTKSFSIHAFYLFSSYKPKNRANRCPYESAHDNFNWIIDGFIHGNDRFGYKVQQHHCRCSEFRLGPIVASLVSEKLAQANVHVSHHRIHGCILEICVYFPGGKASAMFPCTDISILGFLEDRCSSCTIQLFF